MQDTAPETGLMPQQNLLIGQLLFSPARYDPEQEIVYRDDLRFTYRELRARVPRLANGLAGLGVRPGDTVAVMDWDSHRYLECFFAVPMMGATLQTVNVRLSVDQILFTLTQTRPALLLVHPDFAEIVTALAKHITFPCGIVMLPDDGPIDGATCYESLLAGASDRYDFPDLPETTTATTFHTTGTTGQPKQVFYSHRQIVLHTLSLIATYATKTDQGRFDQSDVYMPITPMFHVHAWGIPFMATALGVKQVYPGRYEPERLLVLQQREGVTFSHCVPTILQMLLTAPGGADLSGWKIVVGGAVLTRSLAEQAQARGIDIFCGYGMSETCPLLLIAHVDTQSLPEGADDIGLRILAGRPAILTDVRIVDEAMQDVPADGVSRGELVARAPWLTRGYMNNAEASRALWQGGYLHTGDIATATPDRYVKIVDRLKDVIKTGGEWVSSADVEDLLTRHASVTECAVIGVTDAKWGERPLALIVANGAIDSAELARHLQGFVDQGKLSRFAIPDQFIAVAALDRTSVGKIDKKRLRKKYAAPK